MTSKRVRWFVPAVLALFSGLSLAQVGSAACVGRSFTQQGPHELRYRFVNNCGSCVRMTVVVLRDGAVQLPGEMLSQATQPGSSFYYTMTTPVNQVGTWETKAIKTQACPGASPTSSLSNPTPASAAVAQPATQLERRPSGAKGRMMLCDDDGTSCRAVPTIQPGASGPNTATITRVD